MAVVVTVLEIAKCAQLMCVRARVRRARAVCATSMQARRPRGACAPGARHVVHAHTTGRSGQSTRRSGFVRMQAMVLQMGRLCAIVVGL